MPEFRDRTEDSNPPDVLGGPAASVDGQSMTPGSVSQPHLQNNAVGEAALSPGSVVATTLADGSVDTAKLADLAVEAAKLQDSSVESTKIANAAVGTAAIADLAVGDAQIANVSADKIATGQISVGETISSSNYSAGSDGWAIDGDGNAEFNNVTVRGSFTTGSPGEARISLGEVFGGTQVIEFSSGDAAESSPGRVVGFSPVVGGELELSLQLTSGQAVGASSADLFLRAEPEGGGSSEIELTADVVTVSGQDVVTEADSTTTSSTDPGPTHAIGDHLTQAVDGHQHNVAGHDHNMPFHSHTVSF